MFDFIIKNPFNKTKTQEKRDAYIKNFLNNKNHQWIHEEKIVKRSIEILLNSLKEEHVNFFLKNPTFMIPCQSHFSCAIGKTQNEHLILVFPELIQLLRSGSALHGSAILAHELGHIFHQHTENKIETLKAQIEADKFAFELGFGEELQDVLLDHAQSKECQIRISRLTNLILNQKN